MLIGGKISGFLRNCQTIRQLTNTDGLKLSSYPSVIQPKVFAQLIVFQPFNVYFCANL